MSLVAPTRKMRILLSAFACDPNMGSEPYVGWNWLNLLLDSGYEVVLLTRSHHKEALTKACREKTNLQIVSFDLPAMGGLGHRAILIKPYYIAWQIAALFVAIATKARFPFDMAMHVTYNVVDFPGFLWLLPKTKFIWGPVGGGQSPPEWAEPLYGKEWQRQLIRRKIKSSLRWNPFVVSAVRKSQFVMVANAETEATLPVKYRAKYVRLLETAIDAAPNERTQSEGQSSITRLLWVGQLEPRKGLPLLLGALNLAAKTNAAAGLDIRLTVVGDGPLEGEYKRQCQTLNLDKLVYFAGAVDFQHMSEYYRNSDAFVFTSVQDTSGNVLFEAMSHSLPIISINHQGAAEILDDASAFLISPTSYGEAIQLFCNRIVEVANAPKEALKKGLRGNQRLERLHTWAQRRDVFVRNMNAVL